MCASGPLVLSRPAILRAVSRIIPHTFSFCSSFPRPHIQLPTLFCIVVPFCFFSQERDLLPSLRNIFASKPKHTHAAWLSSSLWSDGVVVAVACTALARKGSLNHSHFSRNTILMLRTERSGVRYRDGTWNWPFSTYKIKLYKSI